MVLAGKSILVPWGTDDPFAGMTPEVGAGSGAANLRARGRGTRFGGYTGARSALWCWPVNGPVGWLAGDAGKHPRPPNTCPPFSHPLPARGYVPSPPCLPSALPGPDASSQPTRRLAMPPICSPCLAHVPGAVPLLTSTLLACNLHPIPQEIEQYCSKVTGGASKDDPFEGLTPQEIDEYIEKHGLPEGAQL